MRIGSKIYYEKATSNIVVNTGDKEFSEIETTLEQDFQSYLALKAINPTTIGVILL